MRRCTLFAVGLALAASAGLAAERPKQRAGGGFGPGTGHVGRFGMEVRPEPIAGVPLGKGSIAPRPVEARAATGRGTSLDRPGLRTCGAAPAGATFEAGTERIPGGAEPGTDGLPNLVFYAPTGWDYPIVPSNVRNTHTVGPDLNDYDTTFFDFAVANNGSSTARPRFYTYLYSDGSVFAGFYTESLPAGYYTYYNDFPWLMPGGTHLIAGFTDSTNVVAESLENDNRWSRSFYWRVTGGARPNLRPYTPSGWDFPVVPSNVRGTHTVGPDLNDYDTTFVDNAFINDGNATARPRFYTYLYLDGRVVGGYYIDSLPQNWYGYYEDDEVFVPAGNHTLSLFVDSFNVVAESNEGDNRWSRSFSWRHDPATLPNLSYYTPDTSWDYPLVPSNVRGTHRVGPDLNDRDTTFVDWCAANFGNAWARPRFYIYLYFDNTPFAGWYLESLPPRTYVTVEDDPSLFPSGMHVLEMVIDSTNAVVESDETDNRYTRGFVWRRVVANQPNLTPYTPPGWDYPIVPANVRNTHIVGPFLNDVDTTFIDLAFANNGSATARPRFYTYLYEDGVPFAGFYLDSLPAGWYAAAEDIERMFAAGDHELAMFIDSLNAVAESLETDNRWARTFHWEHLTGVFGPSAPDRGVRLQAVSPARKGAELRYAVPVSARVRLAVYDASGALVAEPVDGRREPGEYSCRLSGLAAGTYFAVLDAGGERRTAGFVRF